MENTQKHVEILKKQIEKLTSNTFDLEGWKSSSSVLIGRIFSNSHQAIKAIEKIEFSSGGYAIGDVSNFWDNMDSCKQQGKDIIEACILELESFGIPEKPISADKGININLTQNQSVNIDILISAIEQELTVTQYRELEKIMKSEGDSAEKKKNILEKIKGFGDDVASNILANIFTNPAIWG